MNRIAAMQPYFLPFAGYFRLMCDVDVFVLLDDVQFRKGGWIHRNRLRTRTGDLSWLTLPLVKAPVTTLISDLRFRDTAREEIRRSIRRFPAAENPSPDAAGLIEAVSNLEDRPLDLIARLLERATDILDLRVPMGRSSSLELSAGPDRVERLVALCRYFGANAYLNAPGGRALYDEAAFARHGIDLQFLPDYRGPLDSILQRLHEAKPTALRHEIVANLE